MIVFGVLIVMPSVEDIYAARYAYRLSRHHFLAKEKVNPKVMVLRGRSQIRRAIEDAQIDLSSQSRNTMHRTQNPQQKLECNRNVFVKEQNMYNPQRQMIIRKPSKQAHQKRQGSRICLSVAPPESQPLIRYRRSRNTKSWREEEMMSCRLSRIFL